MNRFVVMWVLLVRLMDWMLLLLVCVMVLIMFLIVWMLVCCVVVCSWLLKLMELRFSVYLILLGIVVVLVLVSMVLGNSV